jgi:hypothetical protein
MPFSKFLDYICCWCCSESDDDDNYNYNYNYNTMDNKNVSVSTRHSHDVITPRVSMDNIYNQYSLSDENYNVVYNELYRQ